MVIPPNKTPDIQYIRDFPPPVGIIQRVLPFSKIFIIAFFWESFIEKFFSLNCSESLGKYSFKTTSRSSISITSILNLLF
ncbi:hypothetical protein SDC9_209172 [bioreactor metagenome]|uniref:Uncharacterized protein n=1 Tax=bioreactor metagenome TaxID=1076179 RepID=A0A645JCJ1_9ZZZZ